MSEQKLKTSVFFYLHVLLVIAGLLLPILLQKKYLVYVLIFILVVLLHWILLGGDCIISYLDRMQVKKRETLTLDESFFYKLFKNFFGIKITNFQMQLCSVLLISYGIFVCIYRLYFQKRSKKEDENNDEKDN